MRSSAKPSDRMRSRVLEEGTMIWSAKEKSRGHKSFFKVTFQDRESRGARLLASVPKRKTEPLRREARKAIQKDAFRYPVWQRTASNLPCRMNRQRSELQRPRNASMPVPMLGISAQL